MIRPETIGRTFDRNGRHQTRLETECLKATALLILSRNFESVNKGLPQSLSLGEGFGRYYFVEVLKKMKLRLMSISHHTVVCISEREDEWQDLRHFGV